MRKLGKGQTVVFCIPPEIRVKILQKVHKDEDDSISWLMFCTGQSPRLGLTFSAAYRCGRCKVVVLVTRSTSGTSPKMET